jgi:hypothetical protein
MLNMTAFDSGTDFFKLRIVWGTFIAIWVIAGVFIWIIAANSNLEWCLTGDGFNYFATTFKVPLGVLALMIPIGAVYAANHRSVQTKDQIKATLEQNKFTNYYKHKEEFEKYVTNIDVAQKIDANQIHRVLFGSYEKWTSKINEDLDRDFCNIVQELGVIIKLMPHSVTDQELLNHVLRCTQTVHALMLGYYLTDVALIQEENRDKNISLFGRDVFSFLDALESFSILICKITLFDNDYSRSQTIVNMCPQEHRNRFPSIELRQYRTCESVAEILANTRSFENEGPNNKGVGLYSVKAEDFNLFKYLRVAERKGEASITIRNIIDF